MGVGGEVNAGASMGLGNASGGGFYATYGGITGLDIGVGGAISITKGSIAGETINTNESIAVAGISAGVSVMFDKYSHNFAGIGVDFTLGPKELKINTSLSKTKGCEILIYPTNLKCY